MRTKKNYLLAACAALLVAVLVLGVLLRHEPHFYRACALEPGLDRQQRSSKFANDFIQMVLNVQNQDAWHITMNEVDLNSFLQEDVANWEAEQLRKLGISEPRVAFLDEGQVRIGFRYGSGFWSTVVSYDLRIWSVPKEPNVVAVEVRGRRIGAVPLSAQTVLAELIDLAARHNNNIQLRTAERAEGGKQTVVADALPHNIEVTPYRYEANPVALIRFQFQADQGRPSAQLKCLHVRPGELRLGGSCGASTAADSPKVAPPAAN
jgi:hypothetical protein